jgi:peptidylprolyl isomerase
MRFFALISVLCVVPVLAACGDDDSGSAASPDAIAITTTKGETSAVLREVKATGGKPKIEVPPGPPPKELVVRDLKVGVGPEVVLGDKLGVRYIGVNYASKERFEEQWDPNSLLTFMLGEGGLRDGWEIGLKGMKLGGRRELVIPAKLAFANGAEIYVVELLTLE